MASLSDADTKTEVARLGTKSGQPVVSGSTDDERIAALEKSAGLLPGKVDAANRSERLKRLRQIYGLRNSNE